MSQSNQSASPKTASPKKTMPFKKTKTTKKKEPVEKIESPVSSEAEVVSESESEDEDEDEKIIRLAMERLKKKKTIKLAQWKKDNGIEAMDKKIEEVEILLKKLKEERSEKMASCPIKEKETKKSNPVKKSAGKKRCLTAQDADLKWILSSGKNKYPPCCFWASEGEVEPRWNSTLLDLQETEPETYGEIKTSSMPKDWKGHKKPLRTEASMKKHTESCAACIALA